MSGDEQDRAAQDAAEGDALEQEVLADENAAAQAPTGDAAAAAVAGAGAASSANQSAPTGAAEPDDANDLRGYYFRELLHKPLTWILVGGGSLLVGGILLATFGPLIGVVAFVILFLCGI